METLESIIRVIEQAITVLAPYGDGLAFMIVAMLFGVVMSQRVFTRKAHWKQRPVWFWWWGHKTLPLHPIFAGAIFGLVFKEDGETLGASMIHFAGWGAGSVVLWEVIKQLAKRQGFEVTLPGGENDEGEK